MTRAEACLAKAAECDRAAVLAAEPNIRTTYSNLAKQWRECAAQVEALERLGRTSKNRNDLSRLGHSSKSSRG